MATVGSTAERARAAGLPVDTVEGDIDVGAAARHRLGWLWHAVPAFPTVGEVWLRLLEDYGL